MTLWSPALQTGCRATPGSCSDLYAVQPLTDQFIISLEKNQLDPLISTEHRDSFASTPSTPARDHRLLPGNSGSRCAMTGAKAGDRHRPAECRSSSFATFFRRGMKIVRVTVAPIQIVRQQLSDGGLARARNTHDDYDVAFSALKQAPSPGQSCQRPRYHVALRPIEQTSTDGRARTEPRASRRSGGSSPMDQRAFYVRS